MYAAAFVSVFLMLNLDYGLFNNDNGLFFLLFTSIEFNNFFFHRIIHMSK